MNDEILNNIVALNALLKELKSADKCKIIFENADEAELIGDENSYLKLLYIITNLVIAKNGNGDSNDLIESNEKGLISYEIKSAFDEFGDCWLVNAQIHSV